MKKLFIILAIALGMGAMQSCKCTSDTVEAQTFAYDVTGVAEGVGSFAWSKSVHSGELTLDGRFVVSATNDTTNVKVFTSNVVENAPSLSESVNSENPVVAEAAREARARLYDDLALNGLSGKVRLTLTGYVAYGPMVFALDEEWEYPTPAVDSLMVEPTMDVAQ